MDSYAETRLIEIRILVNFYTPTVVNSRTCYDDMDVLIGRYLESRGLTAGVASPRGEDEGKVGKGLPC